MWKPIAQCFARHKSICTTDSRQVALCDAMMSLVGLRTRAAAASLREVSASKGGTPRRCGASSAASRSCCKPAESASITAFGAACA